MKSVTYELKICTSLVPHSIEIETLEVLENALIRRRELKKTYNYVELIKITTTRKQLIRSSDK